VATTKITRVNKSIDSYILLVSHSFVSRELTTDDMLLYKHSTRCSLAIQMFLNCNPQYRGFVSIPKTETPTQNLASSYTFSTHPHTKQFQTFKDQHDRFIPNFDLDLYNATIIAVCKCIY